MKKNYEEPVMVVQELTQEDVIVTSVGDSADNFPYD